MENGSSLSHRLFIYGTLKRGQPNYFHLENNTHGYSRLVGSAVTESAFPLVISTRWNIPFLLYAPEKGQQIHGEIYDVDDQLLEWLDEFEGHPEMYVRDKVTVNLLSNGVTSYKGCERLGKVECWVYFLKKFPPQMLELESYSSYNAYGSHNKVYKADEDLSNATNIEEALVR